MHSRVRKTPSLFAPNPELEALVALGAGTATQAQLECIKADPKLERATLLGLPLHRLIGKPEPTTTTTAQEEPEREFDEKMATLLLDVFGVQALLESHPGTLHSPLMWACQLVNVKAVRFLLDAGANANQKGRDNDLKPSTPLGTAAAQLAGEELIELLIARGADPNQREADMGELPLIRAISATARITAETLTEKALGTIKALLRHTRWGRQYCELVFSAVYQTERLDLLKLLLECDGELKDYKPPTCEPTGKASEDPLRLLLKHTAKPIEWLYLLLANGHKFGEPIDVNAALHASLREGTQREEAVSALLRHGADSRTPTSDTNETPIFLAYQNDCSDQVIKTLLDAGAGAALTDGNANAALPLGIIDPYGRNELHALAMAPGGRMERLASLLQRGVEPRQKDVAGNSVYIYAVVHQASWMLTQLIDLPSPPPLTDALADDGEHWWMEERVEWNLRRPVTRAMKDHLERSLTILRSKQRDDTTAEMADAPGPIHDQPSASLLDEQQRQIVDTVAAACAKAATGLETMVEVVEEDEWARRNAAHEMCLGALGARFVKMRGKSMLYLLVKQTGHHGLVRRMMKARPELLLVPNQGAKGRTPLESAAKRVGTPSDFNLFRRMLITLKRQNLAIPADLRQRVMRCLLPLKRVDEWDLGLHALALLGPVDVNEPDPESGLPLLHQAMDYSSDGLPGILSTLLRLGADVNAKDKLGRTALFLCDDEGPAQLLLAAGASLDIFATCKKRIDKSLKRTRKTQSALSAVGQVLEPAAALSVITYSAQVSPAHIYYLVVDDFAEMAHALLLKLHCERGSELVGYFKRPDHKSPLWALTKCAQPSLHHNKLVSAFADIVRDIDYEPGRKKGKSFVWRLLQQDPKQHSAKVLRLILPFCAADMCQLDERGRSCLDVALATGNEHFLDYLAHLTTHSVATTTRNGDKDASRRQLGEHARKLVQMRNGRGQTALVAAIRPYSFASQANLGVIKSLTRLGVDVNEREAGTGNTALHYAATTNSVALCKHLLDCGAEINARNEAGETALFGAGRHNHWHTTLFLLLSGADGHATNKAGQCALMASSALCAAVIHDFVTRPRSLEFIAKRLLPLLCPEIDVASLLVTAKVSPSGADTKSSSSIGVAAAIGTEGGDAPADEMSIEASSTMPLPQQHEEEEELQPLNASFPEIVVTMDTVVAPPPVTNDAAAAASSDDGDRMALETNEPTNNTNTTTRTGHDVRRQERQAVARVTALLERVLEALQLYQGAPAETDLAVPRADNENDPEADRRVRWERNESLVRLKGQLTRWLKMSKARIPRITRNLSFSTLSESEMALYLRQWKALQLQKQKQQEQEQEQQGVEGRKRKRVDDRGRGDDGAQKKEEDDSSQPSSQGVDNDDDVDKHIMIDVKRPRLSLNSEDDDLPHEPCLVVPEVAGTIPLPPPFLTQADLLRPSEDQPIAMIQRTAALVHDAVKASVIADVQRHMPDEVAQLSMGLVADDQGYLLDAFLTRPSQWLLAKFDWMVLQAVVALPFNQRCVDRAPYYAVRQSNAQVTTEVFRTQAEAVAAFKERFRELTGHAWADRSQQQQLPVGGGDCGASGASESTAATETEKTGGTTAMAATSAKYLFLPTNHEAVLQQFGLAEQAEQLAAQETAQVLARLPKPGEPDARSDEERVFDLLSFVSNKHQIFSYCKRVGLIKTANLGQLTAAQLKNAFNILDVIAGILTYEEELKWRGRPLPQHVQLARQNLSHAFHCVLPFDFAAHASGLINTVVIDDREKLNQKIDIVQSLQEIGIGLEVLRHDTSLPPSRKHAIVSESAGIAGDDEAEATTVSDEQEKQTQTPADESSLTSDDSNKESKLARMRLLCKALCTKLTPLDKQSDEWDVIEKIMKPGKVQIMDIFAVERKGEAERYRPYANLPNRMLLGHGTGVANVMGILRKGLCVNPIGAKTTGSSLGKGLYFSDQPEKSLKYMKWGTPKVGCFLLCETALGEALIRRSSKGSTTLPPGRHHSLGLGRKICDPSASLHTDDGVMIPLGISPVQPTGARLSHNEFVLHNEDQVRIRYLVLVRG